eukprot:935827-Rhodomonas_salina.4
MAVLSLERYFGSRSRPCETVSALCLLSELPECSVIQSPLPFPSDGLRFGTGLLSAQDVSLHYISVPHIAGTDMYEKRNADE